MNSFLSKNAPGLLGERETKSTTIGMQAIILGDNSLLREGIQTITELELYSTGLLGRGGVMGWWGFGIAQQGLFPLLR